MKDGRYITVELYGIVNPRGLHPDSSTRCKKRKRVTLLEICDRLDKISWTDCPNPLLECVGEPGDDLLRARTLARSIRLRPACCGVGSGWAIYL